MRNKDLISDEFNQKISFLNNSNITNYLIILDKFNKFKPSFAKLNVDVNKENTYQTRPISY